MKLNKNTKYLSAAAITFILLFSLFRVAIIFMLPENTATEKIHTVFKSYFGKAVKFDRIAFTYAGNLILYNFHLSNSTDFNDNINLVKSEKVILDLSLLSLLKNEIRISGIKLKSPEITIIKSSGKNYSETFGEIFLINLEEKGEHSLPEKELSISFSNAAVIYREVFKTGRTAVNLFKVNSSMSYKKGFLKFNIKGRIPEKGGDKKITGYISGKGFIDFNTMKYKGSFNLTRIDLEYFNDFITEKNLIPFNFFGLLSADINVETNNDRIETEGEFDLYSLSSIYYDTESPVKVISNENVSIKFEAESSKDYNNIKLKKLLIDDGYLNAALDGEYTENNIFSLNLATNKINLDKLSDRITPFKNHKYNGKAETRVSLEYNIAQEKPVALNLNFSLKNFNLIPHRDDADIIRISDCNTELTADMNNIILKSDLQINSSDFKNEISIEIKSWNPFRSETKASVKSKRIELSLIKKYILKYIDRIYEEGFIDLTKGYDERSFMKNPEGILFNSNNAALSIKSDNLLISGKADLKDFALDLSLNNGILRTDFFNLQGYDGRFSANIYCVLRQDYPYIKIEGSGSNIDFTGIMRDSSASYKGGGTLNYDYTYETNAFRVGHFVQNGRGGINITLSNGELSGTSQQKKLSDFISDKGYGDININDLNISSWTIGFFQSGANFYVRSFGLRSDKMNFQTYGTFKYPDNLSVPFTVSIKNEDEKILQVPLLIMNKPLEPCIKFNTRHSEESVCF